MNSEPIAGERAPSLPRAFIWRRLHSLFGLWLSLYLFEHLLTNSQAALYLKDGGANFIRLVNAIKDIPFLSTVEILFIALPFLIHGVWGLVYLLTAKSNSLPTHLDNPKLTRFPRNHAYTWQRITAWLLFLGVILHVVQMRFMVAPEAVGQGTEMSYLLRVKEDRDLDAVAANLGIKIITPQDIQGLNDELAQFPKDETRASELQGKQTWLEALQKRPLREGEVFIQSKTPGQLFLVAVRETFKNIWMVVLYSIFVIAACFHAFNGLWTFMISWGITLSQLSQKRMRTLSDILMGITTLLGLVAIWGVYFTFRGGF